MTGPDQFRLEGQIRRLAGIVGELRDHLERLASVVTRLEHGGSQAPALDSAIDTPSSAGGAFGPQASLIPAFMAPEGYTLKEWQEEREKAEKLANDFIEEEKWHLEKQRQELVDE